MPQFDSQFAQILGKLDISQNILITMSKPDGDSVGSSIALLDVFTNLGKNTVSMSSFPLPAYLKNIPGAEKIKISDVGLVNFSEYDMIFIVDSGSSERVVQFDKYGTDWSFPPETFTVCFDHHGSHKSFATIDVFTEKVSSTCELIYHFFDFANFDFQSHIATALYLGIITDSGGFTYVNTTANTLITAGKLIERGADRNFILKNLDSPKNLETFKLISKTTLEAEIISTKKFSYIIAIIKKEDIQQINKTVLEDAINLLKSANGILQSTENTEFGILFIEYENSIKVSFRSKVTMLDLSKICAKFGGGGHPRACAFESKKDLDTVIQTTQKELIHLYF